MMKNKYVAVLISIALVSGLLIGYFISPTTSNPISSVNSPLLIKIVFEGLTHGAIVTSIEPYGLDDLQFTLTETTYHSATYTSSNKTNSGWFQFYIKTHFKNTGMYFHFPQSLANSYDGSLHFAIPNHSPLTTAYVITIQLSVSDGPYPSIGYHGSYSTTLI